MEMDTSVTETIKLKPLQRFEVFEKELSNIINGCSLEDALEIPDFIAAKLITTFFREMYIARMVALELKNSM